VLDDLRSLPGVNDVGLVDLDIPVPGGSGTVVAAVLFTVDFNAESLSATTLAAAVAAHGVDPSVSTGVGVAGSTIAVPPLSGRT
jgi:hypothetical protein